MRKLKPRGIQSFVKVNTESLWLNQDTIPGLSPVGLCCLQTMSTEAEASFWNGIWSWVKSISTQKVKQIELVKSHETVYLDDLIHNYICCSVTQSCPTLCNTMDCSTPGFPVLHHLLEFAQTPVRWVSDAIQPSYPLSSPFPPAFNYSQHQGIFKWVSSLHQVVKVLEFQLQYQSFQ